MENIGKIILKQPMMLPIKVTGNEVIFAAGIAVAETLIMMVLIKNYGVDISGEITESGFKGSIKLQPEKSVRRT